MSAPAATCTSCGASTVPGGFCPKCGTQASGGGGLLALIGWLFIPFLIPLYPIFGTLSTLAMVAAHYLASSRQVVRVVVLGVIAISALGAGLEDPNSGAAPLIAVIGAPVLYFLARRFDRVFGLAGGPSRKPAGAMGSDFVQQQIDGNRTRFAVTPGRAPNKKLAIVLTTAFVLTVFFGIDAESTILIPPVRLGTLIDRNSIGRLFLQNDTNDRTARVANVLWLEPRTGYSVPLAGGMDRSTSERLLAATNRALGFGAVVAS